MSPEAVAVVLQTRLEQLAPGAPAMQFGPRQFRRDAEHGLVAVCRWGGYLYEVPVSIEDAIALARNHAHFESHSCGRGRRSNIRVVHGRGI